MKTKQLLSGDEAFALGAINAGLSGGYAYPGTPSTEILEYLQGHPSPSHNIHSHWSANEKTAVEEALGMSFCGKRAIAAMKHVGLNVAADPFVNSAMTGANGGLIVVSADDPSMHSSQNEQDSRFYGDFAMIPVLEPTNQQEAHDMAAYGFELSERYRMPVLLRLVTRLSHSRAVVEVDGTVRPQNQVSYPRDTARWVLMPGNSRRRYPGLIEDYELLRDVAAASPFNRYRPGRDRSLGIITGGIAINYLDEVAGEDCPFTVLKIAQYPLPTVLIERLAGECDAILVLEEGQPFIEKNLRGVLDNGHVIHGKLDGYVNRTGELSTDSVRHALARAVPDMYGHSDITCMSPATNTVGRPPALCQGCGHRDVYNGLLDCLKRYDSPKVFGDIGCYTLGWLSPFNAIDTVVDMGASITMAKGAADAGQHPSLAVIGDSTFTHSGMTGLLDAVNEDSPITVIITDNLTTGMTGGQDSQGTGKIEDICLGLGVDPDHLVTVDALPRNRSQLADIVDKEINHSGLSVIVARRECLQTARRHTLPITK